MLKKWKPISFKLSNAELEQIKSMPSPAGSILKPLELSSEKESQNQETALELQITN
jgi:hypothetical protein